MEKKSIGGFILALRKANGMTQKQLADKLHVSDKAVSRWERDENLPDLVLIPAMAEIFGVTSDELLRGERINTENAKSDEKPEKTEKQISLLLEKGKTKMMIRSLISAVIGIAGFLVAIMIFNSPIPVYPVVSFSAACIFYIAALVTEIIFAVLAFSAVSGAETESDALKKYKKAVFRMAHIVTILLILLFAATLPTADRRFFDGTMWFEAGAFYTGIAAVICIIGSLIVNYKVPFLRKKEMSKKQKRLLKTAVVTIAALIVTAVGQFIFFAATSDTDFTKGTTFTDLDSFVQYIETDIPAPTTGNLFINGEEVDSYTILTVDSRGKGSGGEYCITAVGDESRVVSLAGNEILTFTQKNWEVEEIHYHWKDDKLTSVTTYTPQDFAEANKVDGYLKICWTAIYIAEVLAAVIIYKTKIKKKP